jgi:DNA-binding transcriptional regulator YdaS (Cro superfamily)
VRYDRDPALIDVFRAMGSATALAKALGLTRAAVSRWNRIPIRHLATISELTKIPRQKLRPDLYDTPADTHIAA